MALVAIPQQPSETDYSALDSGNILILHEISNPGNLGALLRSALWFGFDNIILSTGSVEYTHPKVVRTSMGSLFHLNIVADVPPDKILAGNKKILFPDRQRCTPGRCSPCAAQKGRPAARQ